MRQSTGILMTAQILPLRVPAQPVADFLRIGDTGHHLLADLHAEGRLPARRVVVDASRLRYQKSLVEAFRTDGSEIVLDTKAAELAALAKFGGLARGAPWAEANNGKPLGPELFSRNAPSDVIGQIARFAVDHQIQAVLAPSHFLREGSKSPWIAVDRDACLRLRAALDREGEAKSRSTTRSFWDTRRLMIMECAGKLSPVFTTCRLTTCGCVHPASARTVRRRQPGGLLWLCGGSIISENRSSLTTSVVG
jgi:hypothetical protein